MHNVLQGSRGLPARLLSILVYPVLTQKKSDLLVLRRPLVRIAIVFIPAITRYTPLDLHSSSASDTCGLDRFDPVVAFCRM